MLYTPNIFELLLTFWIVGTVLSILLILADEWIDEQINFWTRLVPYAEDEDNE